eukprot:maker-scaffold_7-snap-gene-18.42-mRNA-1 protein AED:0.01 eAED:0.01 QI:0/1/0.5/1/1/1/2/59/695
MNNKPIFCPKSLLKETGKLPIKAKFIPVVAKDSNRSALIYNTEMGLEYDDSAFNFFLLALLSLVTIVVSLNVFCSSSASSDALIDAFPVETNIQATREKPKAFTFYDKPSEKKGSFISFKKGVLFVLYLLLAILLQKVLTQESDLSGFDPFEILDIPTTATDKEIKKKYRKLSIKWHPDQWVKHSPAEQSIAEAMFMKIARANAALTDPVSRENYRKYGNPDGPQNLEVSLGLPSFLLEKRNQNVVLLVYILVIVILMPTGVYLYYSRSKQYSDKNILNDTYQVYAYLLNPQVPPRAMLQILALSAEFRKDPLIAEIALKDDLVKKLKNLAKLKSPAQMSALFKKFPKCEIVAYILAIYCSKTVLKDEFQGLGPLVQKALKMILNKSLHLITAMEELAKMRRSWFLLTKVIFFRSRLIQGVDPVDSSFLPMLTNNGELLKKLSNFQRVAKFQSLTDFRYLLEKHDVSKSKIGLLQDEKQGLLQLTDPKNGIREPEIFAEIGCMDDIDESGKVIFDKKCGIQDVVTVYVVISYLGLNTLKEVEEADNKKTALQRKEKSPVLVTAPFFPSWLKESFSLSLGITNNPNALLAVSDIIVESNIVKTKLQFKPDLRKPGKYKFDLLVTSKVYVGMLKKITLTLDAVKQEDVEKLQFHAEDLETKKEPGIFDVLYDQGIESDSDFETDEDEAKPKAGVKKS